ncbi:hypothetical protein KW800_03315 [Candidatus Parcubacteria bacterium]|nr:hypothetical protein [Candidatus Parcubacteria bacterium]
MNPWSARRRALIFVLTFFVLIAAVGYPVYYFYFRSVPDCMNGKQDGDETGVDCGGGCQLICKPEVLPLITQGDARLLKIATSTYEAVVLVQNPNISGTVVRAPYTFTVYSGTSNTAPLKVIRGETYIARNSTFALFAGPFTLNDSGSVRVAFDWGALKWEKNKDVLPIVSVSNLNLITASTSAPRLEASLTNKSLVDTGDIEVIALLSDASGNIVGAGKTFIDSLQASVTAPVVFSWPSPFASEPTTIRVIPHILPDKSYIK